ncbi:MAG TPA: hypothetical protein VFY80_06280 [Burkholderiales bacterium]|nr:hypothetical protein [Burkholderiales bacterium]
MAIRRFEVSSVDKKGRTAVVRSTPGGTGSVVLQVNIEATLATDKHAVIALLEQIAKRIAGERWPMR